MFNGQARNITLCPSLARSPGLFLIHRRRTEVRLWHTSFQPSSLGRFSTGTGILTCCPSATPFSLALGPTNPTPINVAWETLGFRCAGFSPAFMLLIPTFSLPDAPPHLAVRLHCRQERSPTTPMSRKTTSGSVASVTGLSPVIFSAQDRPPPRRGNRPVSCYALFK